jgi:xanthine/uracil permease
MVRYGLNDRLDNKENALYGLQHLVLFIANSAVTTVIVANGIGLNHIEISTMLLRTFFLCGVLSIVQARFGHRYPIIDGPSGLWVAVLLNLSTAESSLSGGAGAICVRIELGMMVSGLLVAALGLSGKMKYIARLFTPLVNGVFLMLVPIQLSKSLVQGMFGTIYGGAGIALKEFVVFWFTVGIMIAVYILGGAFLKSIAILIAVVAGWIFSICIGIADFGGYNVSRSFFVLPRLFVWGTPVFDPGIVFTCILATFLLFSNVIASFHGMAEVVGEDFPKKQLDRGSICFGLSTVMSGLFAVVGFVPFASSMGIVRMTGVAVRKPFYLASLAMITLGLIGPVGIFFASIPPSVGYGSLLVLFAVILKQGVDSFKKAELTERTGFAAGIAILTATGIMMQPVDIFKNLPGIIALFASNGLLIGVMFAIILEQVLKRCHTVRFI